MDVREKLVELLEKASYECDEGTRDLWDMRQVADGIADFLIANGVTVQEWISVKDRLPETYTSVLVRVNGYKEILVGWYKETFKDSSNEKFDCWSIEYKLSERSMEPVTHWMLLPQPPKGE